MLKIAESDLQNVLLRHGDCIGRKSYTSDIACLISGLFNILSAVTADIPAWLKILFGALGVFAVGLAIRDLCHTHRTKCTVDSLNNEIVALSRTEIKSTIVAIRAHGGAFAGSYLLYHDVGWNCDFFPNHKTIENAPAEVESLRKYLATTYQIPAGDLNLTFICESDSKKRCVEHNEELRYYRYRLYRADVATLPELWCSRSFVTASELQCRWMSLTEMFSDAKMTEINGDVLTLVRDYSG